VELSFTEFYRVVCWSTANDTEKKFTTANERKNQSTKKIIVLCNVASNRLETQSHPVLPGFTEFCRVVARRVRRPHRKEQRGQHDDEDNNNSNNNNNNNSNTKRNGVCVCVCVETCEGRKRLRGTQPTPRPAGVYFGTPLPTPPPTPPLPTPPLTPPPLQPQSPPQSPLTTTTTTTPSAATPCDARYVEFQLSLRNLLVRTLTQRPGKVAAADAVLPGFTGFYPVLPGFT